VFTGTCDCMVDNKNAPGFFWVSVQHDPLPKAVAANGVSLHYGAAFLVRSSMVKSSTRAITRSRSMLSFISQKMVMAS
jgi:hypothetical protein